MQKDSRMIYYLKHQEINKRKWDDCIENATNRLVFGYSWYLDSFHLEWDALVLDDYEAVFPITTRTKFFTLLNNPIFAFQLGIFYKHPLDQATLELFFEKIPSKVQLIDIQLNFGLFYGGNKFVSEKKSCQYLHLDRSYVEISSNYSKNLKRILKRRQDVLIKSSSELKPLIELFRENRGAKIKEIQDGHFEELESSLNSIMKHHQYKIIECYSENQLIASAFFSIDKERIIYMKGASTELGRKMNAMHFIMNEMIETFSGKNIIFDFGGSSIEAVRKFNLHFGVKEYTYQRLVRKNLFYYFYKFVKAMIRSIK